MSISAFGFTLIRTRELDAIRARVRGLQENPQPPAAQLPAAGEGNPAADKPEAEEPAAQELPANEAEPPRIVRELIRLADRLPELTGDHASATPAHAEEAARWLNARTRALLTACDVERVEDNGPLDLHRHAVVATKPAPASDLVQHIAATVRPGYSWHGHLVRPQQVVVYTTQRNQE